MLNAAASYWRLRGIEGDILCTGNTLGAYASTLDKAGYRIHHIPFWPSHRFVRAVFLFLKTQKYDAVHIHPEKANFWYALTAYLAGSDRIIRTVHNVFPFSSFLRIERYFQRWIMRRLLRVEMVTISESVKKIEREKFFNRSTVIPNWFDSNKIRPARREERVLARKRLGISGETVVFTSIGGCWSYKNHLSIVEAAARLPRELPFLYLHVGQEASGYPERTMAKARGASSNCRFLGVVPEIVPILYASDVYVMPSVFEGFGVAAVEAMGAGLPAILSHVPGLRDLGDFCENIYWVEPKPESIVNAMLYFINMPAPARQEIGRNLSTSVHNHFTVEIGAAAYARLYTATKKRGDVVNS